jgi:hypothetical protein
MRGFWQLKSIVSAEPQMAWKGCFTEHLKAGLYVWKKKGYVNMAPTDIRMGLLA